MAHGRYANPSSAWANDTELHPAHFKPLNAATSSVAVSPDLCRRHCLLIAAIVTAMAGQRHHLLRIFAVLGTVLLARRGHAIASHTGAFDGCCRGSRHCASSKRSSSDLPGVPELYSQTPACRCYLMPGAPFIVASSRSGFPVSLLAGVVARISVLSLACPSWTTAVNTLDPPKSS